MDSEFLQELLKLPSTTLIVRAMCERRDRILSGIENGTVEPGSDVVAELAELNIAIGDFNVDEADHASE